MISGVFMNTFQFHKVQLKDGEYTYENLRVMFQFHKVQLKDAIVLLNNIKNISFNSIRYN